MKLGFIVFAAAQGLDPCHDKSEKRLAKMQNAFSGWAAEYSAPAKMVVRVDNIARKMLDHYNLHNEEICNKGARSGDEEPDLDYDDCVNGLAKILKQLQNWSRANNKAKKSDRVAAKLRHLTDKWSGRVCYPL